VDFFPAQAIRIWRWLQVVHSGHVAGLTSADHAELVAARKRIAELENELAIHRRATEQPGDVVCSEGATRRSR
jgi:transposase